jgi:hypothetical protein
MRARELAVAKVRDCEERVAGAGRAVLRADAEVAQHATHEIDGLLAERTAGAHRTREALVEAVTGLSGLSGRGRSTRLAWPLC